MKTEFQRELDDIFSELDPKVEADARLALDIASQFTALRQRRGLTQAELAEKLGKSQQAVSKIENPSHGGHNLARLKEAVDALDATLDVTLVPHEELDAYRAARVPKPALSGPRADVEHATSQEDPIQNPRARPYRSTTTPRWTGRGGIRGLRSPDTGATVVNLKEYLARRSNEEAAHG